MELSELNDIPSTSKKGTIHIALQKINIRFSIVLEAEEIEFCLLCGGRLLFEFFMLELLQNNA